MLRLPEPCPICGKGVIVEAIVEWRDNGEIVHAEMDCESEPDIQTKADRDAWFEWSHEHYRMPYVDWLPYEIRAMKWLSENYRYDGTELKEKGTQS